MGHARILSITRSIVEICVAHAAGRRVSSVCLEIGDLSGVIPSSVVFCFEACSRNTVLEGARLLIERTVVKARCRQCGTEQQLASYYDACITCGDFGLEILAGKELRVKQLETE
ncbi:MAG: hydrogenase maturation nickel metallochaperone HypA [Syntrophotaleaceae bacterium]